MCFLKKKGERKRRKRNTAKPPEVAWLAGRGSGCEWACPALCFLTPSHPGHGVWGEGDSWGPVRVRRLPGGSFLPTCLRAIRGQGCGRLSSEAPLSGTKPGPEQTFGVWRREGGGRRERKEKRKARMKGGRGKRGREGGRMLGLLTELSFINSFIQQPGSFYCTQRGVAGEAWAEVRTPGCSLGFATYILCGFG